MVRSVLGTLLRVAALTLALYVLDAIDYVALSFDESHLLYPGWFALVAFFQATMAALLVARARPLGWRLVGALFLLLYALRSLLVALEAYYLSDVLPPATALALLANGVVVAALFSPLVVWLYGGFRPARSQPVTHVPLPRSPWAWVWRVPLTGVAYLALFIFAGALVFRPLAFSLDPAYAAEYLASFENTSAGLVLPFQWARGTLWALLTLPMLRLLWNSRWSVALVVAAAYGLIMAPLNLIPGLLPFGIRLAHMAEVFVGNFLFGLAVVWLLGRRRPALEQVPSEPIGAGEA